jgi:hypothetical protein
MYFPKVSIIYTCHVLWWITIFPKCLITHMVFKQHRSNFICDFFFLFFSTEHSPNLTVQISNKLLLKTSLKVPNLPTMSLFYKYTQNQILNNLILKNSQTLNLPKCSILLTLFSNQINWKKLIICALGNFHYKISREKFEPESGFEPRTSAL